MRERIRDIDRLRHIDECIGHVMDFLQEKTFEEMKNDDPIKVTSDPIKQQIYQAIVQDGTLNHAEHTEINMSPVY